jgi:hypothetical protein
MTFVFKNLRLPLRLWSFIAVTAGRVLAHDPYEITSTASVRADRMDVEVEMEFRAAMILAGVTSPPRADQTPSDLFAASRPRLSELAGVFYEVTAGGRTLVARQTNVTLAAENHVRFQLNYPPTEHRPLRFRAAGLQGFSESGPYGAVLTVLDMVNKKVLAQSVLFAATSVAEAGAMPSVEAPAVAVEPVVERAGPSPAVNGQTERAVQERTVGKPADSRRVFSARWVVGIVVAGLIAAAGFWLAIRGSKQKQWPSP